MRELQRIIAKKGLRQKDLAELTNYHSSSVSRWFKGDRSVDIKTFQYIANCLGYEVKIVRRRKK